MRQISKVIGDMVSSFLYSIVERILLSKGYLHVRVKAKEIFHETN